MTRHTGFRYHELTGSEEDSDNPNNLRMVIKALKGRIYDLERGTAIKSLEDRISHLQRENRELREQLSGVLVERHPMRGREIR